MKNKSLVIVIASAVVVAVGGLALWWWFLKEEDSGDQNGNGGDVDTASQVIIGDIDQMPSSDEVVITDAVYENGSLTLSVTYPGCAKHTFRLYVSDIAAESMPLQVSAVLYHDAHDDYCEIGNIDDLTFDMESLVTRFGDTFSLSISDSKGDQKVVLVDNSESTGLANPASTYCEEQGGTVDIRDESAGQVGYCVFSDGSECEEWAYYRGECSPEDQAE